MSSFLGFSWVFTGLDDGLPTQIVSPRPADARICFFAFKISERSVTLLSGKYYDRFQNGMPICGKIERYIPNMGKSFDY